MDTTWKLQAGFGLSVGNEGKEKKANIIMLLGIIWRPLQGSIPHSLMRAGKLGNGLRVLAVVGIRLRV